MAGLRPATPAVRTEGEGRDGQGKPFTTGWG